MSETAEAECPPHDCDTVEVEFDPGVITIVAWVCKKCLKEFR